MEKISNGDQLTLWEIIKEIGFIPLLLIGIGGLSLLDIFEKGVLNHQLILLSPFRLLLNGYERISSDLGKFIDPFLMPALNWFNEWFSLNLRLDPIWRPLFLLSGTVLFPIVRGSIQSDGLAKAILRLLLIAPAMLASIIIGLVGSQLGWLSQGLVGSLPATLMIITSTMTEGAKDRTWGSVLYPAVIVGGIMFIAASGLSSIDWLARGSGVLTNLVVIALTGITLMVPDKERNSYDDDILELEVRNRSNYRIGLSIVGGFIAAALVLAINESVRALFGN